MELWSLGPTVCQFCCVLLLAGCVGTTGLSHSIRTESPYAEQVGARYRLSIDCYIVRHAKGSQTPAIYPGVSAYYRLPLPVDAGHVGWCFSDGEIIGVAPKGTVFRVVDIIRKRSVEYDIVMYYVTLEGLTASWSKIVNAYPLFTRGGGVPRLVPAFGIPVGRAPTTQK